MIVSNIDRSYIMIKQTGFTRILYILKQNWMF